MDPRTSSPEIRARSANYSPLMLAKTLASMTGKKANACPYNCEIQDLDESGYCDHLIGFSNDGKTFEPMIIGESDRRIVRPRRSAKGSILHDKIPAGCRLELGTVSYRVYSQVPYNQENLSNDKTAQKVVY